MNIPDEDKKLVEKANAYEELIRSRGWKPLLDFLAGIADRQLGMIRASLSTQPDVIAPLTLRWRVMEEIILAIQNEVNGTIEDRNTYVREFLRQGNVPEETIKEVVSRNFEVNNG